MLGRRRSSDLYVRGRVVWRDGVGGNGLRQRGRVGGGPLWIRASHDTCKGQALGDILHQLEQRHLLAQSTLQSKDQALDAPHGTRSHGDWAGGVYAGFDPTAQSLHLGNMVTLMGLAHFYLRGWPVVALVRHGMGDERGAQDVRTGVVNVLPE